MLRLPEDDADALKHVGVLTIYKISFIYIYMYIYMYIYIYIYIYVFCAFVGLDTKLY